MTKYCLYTKSSGSQIQSTKITLQFTGFNIYTKDRVQSPDGGTIIVIRKNLTFAKITDINIPDDTIVICGINLTNINPLLKIICYKTPDFFYSENQWDQIINNVGNDRNCLLVRRF